MKSHNKKTRFIVAISLICVVAIAIIYYINIPAISVYSSNTWWLILIIIGVLGLVFNKYEFTKKNMDIRTTKLSKAFFVLLGVGIAVFAIGGLISSEIFSASKFASMITVTDRVFTEDIVDKENIDDIALMDTDSARIVGDRTIGQLSDVVSQFEVSNDYSQIVVNERPMKVAPLEYADFFKYINNSKDGIPGYVTVDPITNEAKYIELSEGMKYTTCAYFNKNLQRHLRFNYPSAIFEGYYFEIDDESNPYYVCPVLKANVGLFGAMDVKGVVICNPINGDTKYYDISEVPEWVDRTYNGTLLTTKYNWYGMLSGGYLNSIFGNKGCKMVTDDFGYKVMEDDLWIYTGVTSVNGDESNIGFVLMNTRTSEARYYKIAGAEEYSAMGAAEGEVQHLGYRASFPSLVNVNGQPTYVMVLKDNGGLVKMYAYVNIEQYNIVGTGTNQKEAKAAYKKLIASNGLVNNNVDEDIYENKKITVEEIRYIVQGTETYVYITDTQGKVYKQNFAENEALIFINKDDTIKVYYEDGENDINTLIKYE